METVDLNNTIYQMDIKDIRTFHRIAEEYIFFSSTYITFSRTDPILGHVQV